MSEISNTVHDAAQYLTPDTARAPSFVRVLFSGFHYVHGIWRWIRFKDIYTNPNNFYSLACGHGLNLVAGDNIVLGVAAQCVMIVQRLMACVDQNVKLYQTCCQWSDAIHGNYSLQHRCEWMKDPETGTFSPSTTQWIQSTWQAIAERVSRVVLATLAVFKEIFILSMCFMDTIEAFSWSTETRNEAVNQLFVNFSESVDSLVKNQERLLDSFNENKDTIQKLLSGIGSSYKVEDLADVVSSTIKASQVVQSVSNIAGNFVQHAGFGLASFLGATQIIPTKILPSRKAPWLQTNVDNHPEDRVYIWPVISGKGKTDEKETKEIKYLFS